LYIIITVKIKMTVTKMHTSKRRKTKRTTAKRRKTKRTTAKRRKTKRTTTKRRKTKRTTTKRRKTKRTTTKRRKTKRTTTKNLKKTLKGGVNQDGIGIKLPRHKYPTSMEFNKTYTLKVYSNAVGTSLFKQCADLIKFVKITAGDGTDYIAIFLGNNSKKFELCGYLYKKYRTFEKTEYHRFIITEESNCFNNIKGSYQFFNFESSGRYDEYTISLKITDEVDEIEYTEQHLKTIEQLAPAALAAAEAAAEAEAQATAAAQERAAEAEAQATAAAARAQATAAEAEAQATAAAQERAAAAEAEAQATAARAQATAAEAEAQAAAAAQVKHGEEGPFGFGNETDKKMSEEYNKEQKAAAAAEAHETKTFVANALTKKQEELSKINQNK
jgi:hypothetical protein